MMIAHGVKIFQRILLWVCLMHIPLARADEIDLLVHYLNQLKSAQVFFKQIINPPETAQAGRVRTKSNSAELIFQRPNLFRLEYQKPYPQIIIGDGRQISYYDIDLKQVTIHPQHQITEGTPLDLFLLGNRSTLMRQHFQAMAKNVEQVTPVFWVKLIQPEGKSNSYDAFLAFSLDQERRVRLLELHFKDHFGQKITLKFDKIVDNYFVSQQSFQLTYPVDVEVIQR